MARGNASRMRVSNPNVNIQKRKTHSNGQSIQQIQEAIECTWESIPKQAKTFLLESLGRLSLHRLAKFWSSPLVVDYTRGWIAMGVSGCSFFIALNYLKLGKVQEARALMLNGSFLLQCANTPIEGIVELCGENFNVLVKDFEVPILSRGFNSVRTPQTIEAYLQEKLSCQKQHMMESFVKTRSHRVIEYVGQIGDDWSGYSTRSHQKPYSNTSTGTQIQLIMVGDTHNEDERHSFNIGLSATLKTLFNDYAEKQGVSLRSLRFSCNGKTLFLSSVGNKTPDELNIRDQDVITVHDTNTFQEASGGSSNASQDASSTISKHRNKPPPKNVKTTKRSRNKTKDKDEKKQPSKREEPIKTLDEYKAYHSALLSKLHEEVQTRLKEIRTRLNALELERQPSKQKRKNKRKKENKENPNHQVLPNLEIGSKAGKPYFMVQVGEVQHLYKTTKPSQKSSCSASSMLDLHGCTREEALVKLDECLVAWVDIAMLGSYPFVIPAKIVCGCGNQLLSETVEKWIREHGQVANAPKNFVP